MAVHMTQLNIHNFNKNIYIILMCVSNGLNISGQWTTDNNRNNNYYNIICGFIIRKSKID